MILELDLGNTRGKWRRVTAEAEVTEQGVGHVSDWIEGRFPASWSSDLERMRIASVLAPATEDVLTAKIRAQLSLVPQFAKSTANCAGVTSAYTNPERLGVDRWLGLIAAFKKYNGLLMVVDVGTALKVDGIDSAGRHLGGYIIPGAALMEKSLLESTDRVRYESGSPLASMSLGRDTRSCVQHGIAAALVGAVIQGIEQCRMALGQSPRLVITGGLGLQLHERLQNTGVMEINVEPDLVLEGLRWALP